MQIATYRVGYVAIKAKRVYKVRRIYQPKHTFSYITHLVSD